MKIEIIPVIIAEDFWTVKEKIKAIESYVDWAQVDVADGKFVQNFTWNKPADLKGLKTALNLEAHLMVEKPEEVIDDWLDSGVKRIIFHFESTDKVKEVISKIKDRGLEAGLALNPETGIEVLDGFIQKLDAVLLLTVKPGQTGQKFLEKVIPKIRTLREKYRDINIEVDGGINLDTASKVIEAGANRLAVGSAIFKSERPEETIKKLRQL